MQLTSERNNHLLWLSAVTVPNPGAAYLALPRKFLSGVEMFAQYWQGPVTVLLPLATRRDDGLDFVPIERGGMPFNLLEMPGDDVKLRALINSAAIVLVPMVWRYVRIPELCASCGVPFVVDADYTPTVREEITRSENKNPLLRWRRLFWLRTMEHRFTTMARVAQGIQLLGPHTFETYSPLNPSPLMYFDSRVRRSMLPPAERQKVRRARLSACEPLRLVYSGRWRDMKGVLDLPRVARELRRLGVHAEWDIFGSGVLERELQQSITAARLDNMHLRGELPFHDLMQFVTEHSDLFVCCHKQGDPSTTFVEMLSMGVPLVGYDTPGLNGIVNMSHAGWLTPRNNPGALASHITALHRDRAALSTASDAALEFVQDKCFEDMTQKRVAHLRAIAAANANASDPEVARA